MKKLVKKALPIIMATMLVTSMTAVSTSAVEEEGTVSTYVNEETGVKLECETMALSGDIVSVDSGLDFDDIIGMYEARYDVAVYTHDGADFFNYKENPITLYLPCEKEGCYVIADTGAERGDGFIQLESEYVDGYYKVTMPDWADYYICEYPLVEGYSKMEEQTLVDEKTGITVSGKIETGSRLVAFDAKDMYDAVIEGYGHTRYAGHYVEMAKDFEGYGVFIKRNFEDARIEGDLTITLPNENKDYEVRCFNYTAPTSDEDADLSEALGFSLYTLPDPPAEELAETLTALMNRIYKPLETEYADGKYTLKNDYIGYFYMAPAGSFVVTAEDVERIRTDSGVYDDYEDYYEDPTQAPTQSSTQAPTQSSTQAPTQSSTQASTQAPTQTSTQASTQAPTTATQNNGTVNTSDSRNVAVLLAVLGTASIFVFRKRIAK